MKSAWDVVLPVAMLALGLFWSFAADDSAAGAIWMVGAILYSQTMRIIER